MIVMARTILEPNVESLMVVQMKRDKLRGSEDLETFGKTCEILGLIFYSFFGGQLVTRGHTGVIFFYLTLFSGILIFIAALIYPKSSEDQDHSAGHQTNTAESFSSRWAMIKQYLKVNEIRNTLIFFFIVSIVSPNLEEYFIYFNEEEHHVKVILEGYSSIVLGIAETVLLILYSTILVKRVDLRSFVMVASAFRVLSSLVAIY